MRSSLPDWAQWIQAMGPVVTAAATVAIGAIVAFVAWRQWQTAREKLALDLFEDRIAVYSKVLSAIRLIERPGRSEGKNPNVLLREARDEAQFLFGPEVTEYVRRLISAAANLGLATSKHKARDEAQDWPEMMYENMDYLSESRHYLPILLSPYMRMNQRLPNTRPGSAPNQKDHAALRKAALESAKAGAQ